MRISKSTWVILAIILVGFTSRFISVIWEESWLANFSAIGAIALFSGAYLKGLNRWLLPLAVLWASDLLLNNLFYSQYFDGVSLWGEPSVYVSFGIIILLAAAYLKRKPSILKLLFSAVGAAVAFFLITNFAVWLNPISRYTKDFSGLLLSYEMGLPFFRNTLLGNMVYGALFFGAYELIAKRNLAIPSLFQEA